MRQQCAHPFSCHLKQLHCCQGSRPNRDSAWCINRLYRHLMLSSQSITDPHCCLVPDIVSRKWTMHIVLQTASRCSALLARARALNPDLSCQL